MDQLKTQIVNEFKTAIEAMKAAGKSYSFEAYNNKQYGPTLFLKDTGNPLNCFWYYVENMKTANQIKTEVENAN